MWGVGLRAQHSSGLSAVGKPWSDPSITENGPHGKGIRPLRSGPDHPVPPASGALVSHRVRALRRGQPVRRAGGHAARPARARHRPRRDRRVLGRRVQRGHHRGGAEPPRRRATRGDLGRAARRGGVPGRAAVPGVEPSHPRRSPLLEPGPARHLPPRRHPRHVRGAGHPPAGGGRRPRHRRRGRVLVGAAPARPARQRRAARDLPADPPRRPHPGRRRGRRHRAPVARPVGAGRPDLRDERGR